MKIFENSKVTTNKTFIMYERSIQEKLCRSFILTINDIDSEHCWLVVKAFLRNAV